MKLINGKKIAQSLRSKILTEVISYKNKYKLVPTLAVILVGEDTASSIYVKNKKKFAKEVGIESKEYKFPCNVSEKKLVEHIDFLNKNKDINGILVQLPLPKHIDTKKIIYSIDHKKDVDGFHIMNVGKLSIGEVKGKNRAIIPCTPLGCLHLIKDEYGSDLSGLKMLIVGSSNIVGKPLAKLLMIEKCTVTIANKETKDLKSECKNADIIISATGVPLLIKEDMVHKNSIIIDVGINRIVQNGKEKIVGDVDFDKVSNIVRAITPVPKGVGPMTVAYLLRNTLDAFIKQNNFDTNDG